MKKQARGYFHRVIRLSFFIFWNDHGDKCTCFACVMAR